MQSPGAADETHSHATVVLAEPTPSATGRRTSWWSLPSDVLAESVRRIRILAWLYATGYFLAGLLPGLVTEKTRAWMFSSPIFYLPSVVSIVGAITVALLVSHPRLSARTKVRIGLVFEVVASLGIAIAEYHDIVSPILMTTARIPAGFGLSFVAPWVMLFGVVVPTRPVATIAAAALSLAIVPLTYLGMVAAGSSVAVAPDQVFFALILPYLIILLMVYVGSRVVYRLGTAVREARELGSYRLREKLGAGGMGEVWRADHRLLVRPAAIKLIRPEILGGGEAARHLLVQRFQREAQATALMRSAHTVELYDFGMTEDGTFYYVMELLDGLDLSQLVRSSGPVPPERALHFLQQICDSLGEAHAAGLIHRDVKPANIHVCRQGRKLDFIKVLDFGLVKHGGTGDQRSQHLTGDLVAGGTPAFMSPEQALGDQGVDGRSDLYSVGCVAYWLLTGTTVFQGQTPMETIVMHVNREPEPPSRRTTQAIPPALESIILECLAKHPESRPQTADELAARLAAVHLERDWTSERAREWWEQHRPGPHAQGPAEAGRPLVV